MAFSAARYLLLALMALCLVLPSRAGMASYSDRGKTDFDTALQLLNPYGTWSKIDGLWAYTPTNHQVPYTNGRWIYTDYGWYWKGSLPYNWVTDHYGYWKCGADKVWSWYPGPFWLPEIVELRATSTYIGWRSAAVDDDGNFIEAPVDRYSKMDEWTFVSLTQFAGQITPGIVASPNAVKDLLMNSTESQHSYFTYHPIDRPGPHPADFVSLSRDGGMFPRMTVQDEMAFAQAAHANPMPAGAALSSSETDATATNAPGAATDPAVDMRRVKYWIIMSLPSYWTAAPPDAKSDEIYLFHPDFYQDNDGIARRITLWFNPKARVSLQEALAAGTTNSNPKPAVVTTGPHPMPIAPATPAVSAQDDAFRSPLDDDIPPPTPSASSKHEESPASQPPSAPVPPPPSNAPIPLPATNAPSAHAP